MKYDLKATQCRREGKLYLKGTVTAPIAGYVVDTLSLSLTTSGENAGLVMDLFAPSGGGLRSITGSTENNVDVTLSFSVDTHISQLTVYIHGETITLNVTQIRDPEPTD